MVVVIDLNRRGFLAGTAAVAIAGAAGARASAAPMHPGRRIVYSYSGLTPPAALLTKIARGQVGGVIFFSENISSATQLRAVAGELAGTSPVPLLLLTDQEGGRVNRVPGGPAASAKQVGEAANPTAAAREQAKIVASVLQNAGLNADLAPVLGVYRTPGDFLDTYERSFSDNPDVVSASAESFIRTAQSSGIAVCAKHFPGLGAAPAGANTDEVPVTINLPASTLEAVDMAPYSAAIRAGVRMIMPSWAIYPALDPSNPAGMSQAILRNWLRGRFKFQGTIITDALEAGSLSAYGSTGNRAVTAVRAGADLLCCSSRDIAQGAEAAEALARAGL